MTPSFPKIHAPFQSFPNHLESSALLMSQWINTTLEPSFPAFRNAHLEANHKNNRNHTSYMKGNQQRGIARTLRMKGINKGGNIAKRDGFDRSNRGNLAVLIDAWKVQLDVQNYSPRTIEMHHWALRQNLAQKRKLA